MKKYIAAVLAVLTMIHSAVAGPAEEIINASGIKGGLVVYVGGSGNGELVSSLRINERYIVHGLEADPANISKVRKTLLEQGLYGPVSVDLWDGQLLPFSDNLINLIVLEDGAKVDKTELLRVLAPLGAVVGRHEGRWQKALTKPWPENIDEWNHYFNGADGNPVANDEVVGPPKRLQWIGSPGWARHHDHMASMTTLVSAKGRLFYIFDEGKTASIQLPSDWKLIARDAFNGTILWKRKIDEWNTRHYPLKSGPAHLVRRLAAVGDRVYVTLGIDAPAMALDAATGETLTTFDGSKYTREIIVSEGTAFMVADSSPSPLPSFRRVSTYVWDNKTEAAEEKWGWSGQTRNVLAYDAQTGKSLWKKDFPVAPCSLAADKTRVVFYDGEKLVCLNRSNGTVLWKGEPAGGKELIPSNTGPRVVIYGDVVLFSGNDGKMSSWSAKNGKQLWENKQKPSGHSSLKDLYVVDGLVWTGSVAGSDKSGDVGTFTGYDPVSGKTKKEFPIDIDLNWFHHRCYPSKAAGNYILTARNGTEFVDVREEHWTANHWVRGGCLYGVMPCNGMLYASMDACGCQLEAKLDGFKALAPGAVVFPKNLDLSGAARLQKGPAFGKTGGPVSGVADWPTYRHDASRSGSTAGQVGTTLKKTWQARLGGRLSAPTVADGKLFVSAMNTHTVHALDAASGAARWTYTVGGRVDSPPTYYKGLVLFGSADGYVYALRALDGVLAWRFRAAPMDRRMMAWEQIESAWPVHGSVLIQDGVLYCTAGRNMFLDGGIRFIRLDPASGRLIGEEVMNDTDPESGKEMHEAYVKNVAGNNMPVALSDVLSCDGKHIWMRSQKFTMDGKRQEIGLQDVDEQPNDDAHLFCQIGFLDDAYFFRSYWSYGRRVSGGYGGWMKAERLVPSGRILCFDDKNVYGFGRKPQYMANASVLEYEFFAADKDISQTAIDNQKVADRKINAQGSEKSANTSDWRLRSFFPREELSATTYKWTVDEPAVICRAMAAAGDTVFFAGPPSVINERWAYYNPDDPAVLKGLQQQVEALDGKQGGQLWAVSKKDGTVQARYALDGSPVFDGMAAANGRLYTVTMDGRILCLSAQGTALTDISNQPLNTAWEQEEVQDKLDPSKSAPSKKGKGGKKKSA